MALPVLELPKLTTTLPMSEQEISYRPFLVKEEKVMIMALEGKDPQEITNAMIDILSACVYTDIDIANLPLVDAEFLLIKIRGASKGNKLELVIKCQQESEGILCAGRSEVDVSLDDITLSDHDTSMLDGKIIVDKSKNIGICLTAPVLKDMAIADSSDVVNSVVHLIKYIWSDDEMWYAADHPKEELTEFIERLTDGQFVQIQEYMNNIPTLELKISHKCNTCGHKSILTMRNIEDFLA